MLTKLSSGFTFRAGPPASIDFTGAPTVTPATLLGVVDPTTGSELYVADDPALGGQWQGRVLVLDGPAAGTASSDQLLAFVNDGRTAAGDDTLQAFRADVHADAAAALVVAEAQATENTLKGVGDDVNNFSARNHADLQTLDGDVKGAAAQAHVDAGTAHADSAKLDADLNTAAAQAHGDAGQIDADIRSAATQAHQDSGQLDADVVSGFATNHQDLAGISGKVATAAKQDTGNASLAAIATGIGAPADADPGSDAAAGSVLARLARLLASTTGLAALLGAVRDRLPAALVGGRLSVDGSGVVQPVSGTAPAGAAPVNPPLSVSGVDAAGLKRHLLTDAAGQLATLPFAPVRGTTVRLTVGSAATTTPPKFPATAGVTSYRVRNEATSASPVTWAMPSSSPPAAPVIPTPYDAMGAGGAPGDKTIDPGGVEVIALSAAQVTAAAAGNLMLSAICPAGGSAVLAVTLSTGA